MSDAIRSLVAKLRTLGCTIRESKHIIVTCPNGKKVSISRSASDGNAIHNIKRDLRKQGVNV